MEIKIQLTHPQALALLAHYNQNNTGEKPLTVEQAAKVALLEKLAAIAVVDFQNRYTDHPTLPL
jgi:hypothetical protein